MTIIDIIKGFFSSSSASSSLPPRLDKDKLASYVVEARRIAEEAEQRGCENGTVDFDTPEFDPYGTDREVQKSKSLSRVASSGDSEAEIPIPQKSVEPPRRTPPNLHAAVLSFPARLLTYVNEKCGGLAPIAYKRAGVSRQVYSRIVSSDDSFVDKHTAMLFCIGLQLTMNEAELLMKSAGYAFSDTIPYDLVFSYCIQNKIWNIKDVYDILVKSGFASAAWVRNLCK